MPDQALITVSDKRIAALRRKGLDYARRSKSKRTKQIYKAAWADFREFCEMTQASPLPATSASVAAYVVHLAEEQKVSTIQLKLAAIAEAHQVAHAPDPTKDVDVKLLMAGIRRELGTAPEKKAPLLREQLEAMLNALPPTLVGTRDKAIILIGWAGAFRRSELVGLDVDDVHATRDRLTLRVRRSKTDPEGKGMTKTIPVLDGDPSAGSGGSPLDPARALRAWLAASGITSGPLFRAIDRWGHVRKTRLTDKAVALIVKAAARRAGLDAEKFAGHSLRSGFITEAASAGVLSRDIMAQTGHKSERVMQGYIQDAGLGAAGAVRAAFGKK
jgi:integrase